jgi:transglutaminase-like putative cysteine protease
MTIKNSLAFFIGLLGCVTVAAQPKEELYRLQQKYPDQSAVFTSVDEVINIEIVNGRVDVKMKVEKESMLLDDRAALYAESRVSYSSLVYLADIQASTFYPGDKRYKEIKVEEFKERDKFSNSIFHDDVKEKKFSFPGLVKGAKRKVTLNYEMRDPHLLSSFIIPEYFPVEQANLKIVCPSDLEIGYTVFNGDSVDVVYEKRLEKGKTIHEWRAKDVRQAEDEEGAPGHLYYTPHIVYYIKSYMADGKREKVLGTVDELHNYYSRLVQGINVADYTPLKNLTDSLTRNATGDEDKVKAIYYWVKDNIKYIAFESGYEGFIPRQAKDVFEKRFGDCKDMSSILTDMLKYAGIQSHLTWIGSRELPYSYQQNPTSGSDNHMIATVKLNDKYVFLDATSTHTPFGYPSAFTQGKEAIVHLAKDKYEVVKVPEVPEYMNTNNDSVFIEIDTDLKITGRGYAEYTGFERDNMLEVLDDNSKEERMKILKNYYQKGSNKFILESFEELNAEDRDKPFGVTYSFNLSDYVLSSGKEIFINMNLEHVYAGSTVEKDRKLDMEYRYKQRVINTVMLKIPDGYELSYLPPNDSLNHELFGFSITYTHTGNTVLVKNEVLLKCLMLKKDWFEAWNDFITRLKKNYSESVALRKK